VAREVAEGASDLLALRIVRKPVAMLAVSLFN
jgi:hypothetical protein